MKADFYFDFENTFRGSVDQIKDILSNYDGLIQYIISIDDQPTLLDIGCGRGEWLKKCSDQGIKSRGIELNSEMAGNCKKYGLDILYGDAMILLKDLPDNSFSLITIFHMIEHISFDSINLLLIECKRLLKEHGLLILETPSIDNLSVSSRLFYIDPTHVNPINPDLIAFTMGRIGFDMIKTFYINGGPLQNEDKYSLTRIFNGVAQDLVLIATKSRSSTLQLTNDDLWVKTLKQGLTTIDASLEFDHQLRINSIKKDELINQLAARINFLENNLHSILQSKSYTRLVLISNYIDKFLSKLRIIKNRLCKPILKLGLFFIDKIYKIFMKSPLKNSSITFYLFRFFDVILRNFNYSIKYGKVLKISTKTIEDIQLVASDEHRLDMNYDSSLGSKDVFNDLK